MTWLVCPDCNKYVRLKPWLGTLHFCLTDEERAQRAHQRQIINAQIEAQKALHARQFSPFGSLFNASAR